MAPQTPRGSGRPGKPVAPLDLAERLSNEHAGVEFFRDTVVLIEQRVAVDVGELDGAHVGERLLHAGAPETDVLHGGHDPAEQPLAEQAHVLRGHGDLDGLLHRQAEVLPQLLLVEAIPHVVAGLDHELLALRALAVGELRVEVAQREPPEGDVACLVLHHVGVDGGGQAVLGEVADTLEGGQGEALDEDLHAEIGHVPAPVGQHRLQERLEPRRDRVGDTELLVQQPRVRLHVARLVHHLRGRIELRVQIGDGLDDPGGGHQRTLLAVHELREGLRLLVVAQVDLLLVRHLVPERRAEDRDQPVVDLLGILRVEVLRPVDAGGCVPLLLLAFVVERQQPGPLVLRHDDAALAERLLARQQHAQHVMFLSSVLVVVAAGPYAWVAVLALVLGAWVGDYPSRRVLLDERWTLATCLRWQVRFSAAWLGLPFVLLLAPSVIQAAGPLRWPVAAALALVLGLWAHQYTPTFLWLVRAAPIAWPPGWQALSESSHARRPHLLRMPVPGGRFVSAFAFPSTRAPSVLFTDPALELLSAREQTAVFAHALSHLEHGDRRRCHLAAAISYALVAGATLGAALAFDWLPPGLFISFWSIALIVAFAWRLARQKAHETESDLRALALCNDAEALISGLTKLTMAGRLPRRWSSELEHGASHPSLARRLHAIRRAAGIARAPSPLEEPFVVPTTRAGAFVTLDLERVWVNDVRYPAQKAPKFLRKTTGSAWSAAYADLVELRIRASWRGGAALVARDRTGRSRGVTIAADDVATLQRRLDAVEPRLAHDGLLPAPPALG